MAAGEEAEEEEAAGAGREVGEAEREEGAIREAARTRGEGTDKNLASKATIVVARAMEAEVATGLAT